MMSLTMVLLEPLGRFLVQCNTLFKEQQLAQDWETKLRYWPLIMLLTLNLTL